MITVYGANCLTLQDLYKITLTRPKEAGNLWKGISHGDVIDSICDEVKLRGWKTGEMKFSVSKDKADFAGAIELDIPRHQAPQGTSFAIGILHSNARKMSLRLMVGATVAVCRNGLTSGTIVLRKKHTMRTDFSNEIEFAIDRYTDKIGGVSKIVKKMRQRELKPFELENILIEAGRRSVVPWSRLSAVDEELRHPEHEIYEEGTVWTLYNAFTFVIQRSPPLSQLIQIEGCRTLLEQLWHPSSN